MRTKYSLTCSCRHKATINMNENDQPFSKAYEYYTLENLNGNDYSVDGFAEWSSVFSAMKPIFPKCGTELTENNFDFDQSKKNQKGE